MIKRDIIACLFTVGFCILVQYLVEKHVMPVDEWTVAMHLSYMGLAVLYGIYHRKAINWLFPTKKKIS